MQGTQPGTGRSFGSRVIGAPRQRSSISSREGAQQMALSLLFLLLTLPHLHVALGDPADTHGLRGKLLGTFNCDQIAYFKTYKTGSTSLAEVMYRIGVVHKKVFHSQTARSHILSHQARSAVPADFVINHSTGNFQQMQTLYRRDLGGNPGRLTIVRDAARRYISSFYFYIRPGDQAKSITDQSKKSHNLLSQSFGITSEESLGQFEQSSLFNETVFLSLERFNEGLAALHLHCGWPIKDLMHLHDASGAKALPRYDGKVVKSPEHTPPELVETIRGWNSLDDALVRAATRKWERVQAQGAQALRDATAEMERQQGVLADYCRRMVPVRPAYKEHPGCLWLSLADNQAKYEKTISQKDGRVAPETIIVPHRRIPGGLPSTITIRDMMTEGYDKIYAELFG